ncbi:MAG: hypothetical protein EPO26_11035 [Chloroflexota bacterium]|nr:MAG: hypothetical protein EPO26_11035 [Chloroflexota bacterium]
MDTVALRHAVRAAVRGGDASSTVKGADRAAIVAWQRKARAAGSPARLVPPTMAFIWVAPPEGVAAPA